MNANMDLNKFTAKNIVQFVELYKELSNVATEVRDNSLYMKDMITDRKCETERHLNELDNMIIKRENEIRKLNHL
jgi:hypothetical protein